MDIQLDSETVIKLLLIVVAAAVVVTKVIDGLKAINAIPDAQAGKWNQALSFVSALAIFILNRVGGNEAIPQAESWGLEIAAVLVTSFSVAILARAIHGLVKWMEEKRKPLIAPVPDTVVTQNITNEAKSGAKPTSSEVTMNVTTAPVDKP